MEIKVNEQDLRLVIKNQSDRIASLELSVAALSRTLIETQVAQAAEPAEETVTTEG